MYLSSPLFVFLFLPVVLTAYLLLPSTLRIVFLLAVSLLFYAWGAHAYLALLVFVILLHYFLGLALPPTPAPGRAWRGMRTGVLSVIFLFDLGLLVLNRLRFLASSANNWGGLRFDADAAPLGISFFVLALLSYAIDVYQRRIPPARDPLRFATYVALFPKILAGPIVRYREIASQLTGPQISRSGLGQGAQRFITGLAKKVLIADTIAPVVNRLFATPAENLTSGAAWLAVIGFGLQIYFDFSGYSDMAIGLGKMLGFEFLENFDHPYVSRSLGEFWRRWHISLSTWLRDYLFLPIAYAVSRRIQADRVLKVKAEMWSYSLATLATMLLCGLWHGVTWGCAVWGLWHGLFLTLEASKSGKALLRRCGSPARLVLAQWIVLMGWIPFRAPSMAHGAALLRVMYGLGPGGARAGEVVSFSNSMAPPLALALGVGFALCMPLATALRLWSDRRSRSLAGARPWIPACVSLARTALLLGLLIAVAMTMVEGTFTPFVYQQF